jgi:PIN domain nuclease of toxin-antitoxin system
VRLLLDTHTLLWWAFGEKPLSTKVTALIVSAESEIFLSAASFWELAIKLKLGKLSIPMDLSAFQAQLEGRTRVHFLPVTTGHAVATLALPKTHRDPFDRMLVAQCQVERLTLASRDKGMRNYPIQVVW